MRMMTGRRGKEVGDSHGIAPRIGILVRQIRDKRLDGRRERYVLIKLLSISRERDLTWALELLPSVHPSRFFVFRLLGKRPGSLSDWTTSISIAKLV